MKKLTLLGLILTICMGLSAQTNKKDESHEKEMNELYKQLYGTSKVTEKSSSIINKKSGTEKSDDGLNTTSKTKHSPGKRKNTQIGTTTKQSDKNSSYTDDEMKKLYAAFYGETIGREDEIAEKQNEPRVIGSEYAITERQDTIHDEDGIKTMVAKESGIGTEEAIADRNSTIGTEDAIADRKLDFEWGAQLGTGLPFISEGAFSFSDLTGQNSFTLDISDENNQSFDMGLFLRASIKDKFFIQSEPRIGFRKANYVLEKSGPVITSDDHTENYYDIHMPMHFGLQLGGDKLLFRAQSGLVLGKRIGGRSTLERSIPDNGYEQNFKNLDMGWQLGVGVDIFRFTVDLRYGGDFSKYGNHMEFYERSADFNNRQKQLNITLGWKL